MDIKNVNFLYENIIFIPAISFLFAVFIKWIITKIKDWKVNYKKALGSWWMPSVHSAIVTSITTSIWLKYWVNDDLFAICMIFTLVIIYDAINIRYQAWLHASAINKMIWEKFKESLWHLPSEAFAWSILWICTALLILI